MATIDYGIQYRIWHNDSPEHIRGQIARCETLFGEFLSETVLDPALDIGCAMGFAMLWLQERGYEKVEGVDLDASQIASCQAKGLDAKHVADTADYLESRHSYYGLILMLDVLEHVRVDDQLALLSSVCRALKPGGRLVITVPNASSPIASHWRYLDFTHWSAFTDHSLRFVLLNAGFEGIRITSSDPAAGLRHALRPDRLLRSLFDRAHRRSLRLAIVRWVWRQVLAAELPTDVSQLPLGRNLHAVAFRRNAANGSGP